MIVQTRYGKVAGRLEAGVAVFKGIPYAAPPFGELRFQAPAPPAPWEGVREAYVFGAAAPQVPAGYQLAGELVPGEDCLNLNVWAPSTEGPHPVLVWVHGGGLRNGSSSFSVYDGSAFARDGVVLVSVNYRVSVDGFALFPDAPANRGLLDLVAALRWVRDNIAEFGGDPGRVTIAGQSAGSFLCAALAASPVAEGLFQRAILQSGPPGVAHAGDGSSTTGLIAAELGVAATAGAFARVPTDQLLAAEEKVFSRFGMPSNDTGYHLTPDGEVLPAPLTEALAGRAVDLLLGATAEELRGFLIEGGVYDRPAVLVWAIMRYALHRAGVKGAVIRQYRRARPGISRRDTMIAVANDLAFRGPYTRLATGAGGRVWMYEFAWRSPKRDYGAAHGMELPFVFDTAGKPELLDFIGADPPSRLADVTHAAWVAFARDGDPGWPAWHPDRRPVMVFDTEPALAWDPRPEELRHWL